MKIKFLLYIIIAALTAFGIIEFIENKKMSKELSYANGEVDDLRNELDETKTKLDEVSEKLGSSSDDIEEKINNIESYANDLEGSIDDLMRAIRWADCDACSEAIWDIERKAKEVESDFGSLQSEINN